MNDEKLVVDGFDAELKKIRRQSQEIVSKLEIEAEQGNMYEILLF